ncbi:MAG: carbamoyltransferase [Acidobacteriota bacterium]
MPTTVLGLSAYYHDSAACLLADGQIVAAAQEERFTRKKHDHSFPANAARYCLSEAGIEARELDYVAFYDKPIRKFERLFETYIDFAPDGLRSFLQAMPLWIKEKLWIRDMVQEELGFGGHILFGDHHESHAASAFYPSPFEEAAILTMDGVGEWATSSIGLGRGNKIELMREMRFPHSVGLLYSAFTYFTGFKVNSGEYKLMGLAPYGEPKYVDVIKDQLVRVFDDGSIWLNMDGFEFAHGLTMTGRRFEKLFGGPARKPESRITQREMDIARSIQVVTEEVVLKMAKHARQLTGANKICMAGGVALNCVANGRLLREGVFDDLWIQPAAGDAGGALGVALSVWHSYLGKERVSAERQGTVRSPTVLKEAPAPANPHPASRVAPPYADAMRGAFLGPAYSSEAIASWLTTEKIPFHTIPYSELPEKVASMLAGEKVVGLMQGRMEFGPRALGGRSILGDARSPTMQSVMNLKIKFRESFRPFAPSVLREQAADWFEFDGDSPYMLLTADVARQHRREMTQAERSLWGIEMLNVPRSTIPAITHVDYSARLQTVRRDTNPIYYDIISAFYRLTGCPVIVNTSFNVRGEPIVCSPIDAYRCFRRTAMDVLVMENHVLYREEQPPIEGTDNWQATYTLD